MGLSQYAFFGRDRPLPPLVTATGLAPRTLAKMLPPALQKLTVWDAYGDLMPHLWDLLHVRNTQGVRSDLRKITIFPTPKTYDPWARTAEDVEERPPNPELQALMNAYKAVGIELGFFEVVYEKIE